MIYGHSASLIHTLFEYVAPELSFRGSCHYTVISVNVRSQPWRSSASSDCARLNAILLAQQKSVGCQPLYWLTIREQDVMTSGDVNSCSKMSAHRSGCRPQEHHCNQGYNQNCNCSSFRHHARHAIGLYCAFLPASE
jgi:hypothetical protein